MTDFAETIRVAASHAAECWSGEPAAVQFQQALAALWGTADRMGTLGLLMGRFVQSCAQHARNAAGRFEDQAVPVRRVEQAFGPKLGQRVSSPGQPTPSASDYAAWQVFDGLNHAWDDEAQHTAPHDLHVTFPFPPRNDHYDNDGRITGATWDAPLGGGAGSGGDGSEYLQPPPLAGYFGGGGLPSMTLGPSRTPSQPGLADPPGSPGDHRIGGGTGSPHEGSNLAGGGGAGGIGGGRLTGVDPGSSGASGETGVPGELRSPGGLEGVAGRGAGAGASGTLESAGRSGGFAPLVGGHGSREDERARERRYWLAEDEAWAIEEPLPGVLMGEYQPPRTDDEDDW